MTNDDLKCLQIGTSATISEAMVLINKNSRGIVFVIDARRALVGCLTDGDVRRWLIDGGDTNARVEQAMYKTPRYVKKSNIEQAEKLMCEFLLTAVPICDDEMRIIDVIFSTTRMKKTARKSNILQNVPVVIMAGGKGTRLDPYTRILPKPLIPVGDIPIIERIMRQFEAYGCMDFHVIVNYKREIIKAYFNENERHYNIHWYDESKPLGTGGGLSLLKGRLRDTFFLTNCDIIVRSDLSEVFQFHKSGGQAITIVGANKSLTIPYGVIELGDGNLYCGMKEKPEVSFLTNTGVYVVEPEVLEHIADETTVDFPNIITQQQQIGEKIAVFSINEESWLDMGQLSELERMRNRLDGE